LIDRRLQGLDGISEILRDANQSSCPLVGKARPQRAKRNSRSIGLTDQISQGRRDFFALVRRTKNPEVVDRLATLDGSAIRLLVVRKTVKVLPSVHFASDEAERVCVSRFSRLACGCRGK
jgi:hypothetical protein